MLKKAVDPGKLTSEMKERLSKTAPEAALNNSGIAGTPIIEAHPEFISLPNEKIVGAQYGSRIVIGRDRPSNRISGYGGKGDNYADAIDIVVGAMSTPKFRIDTTADGQKVYADPNFQHDAARIYISQKTDIDKNFGLVPGSVGNPETRSGIGIKADHLRFVAREGIKLVTGVDGQNSQGGKVNNLSGIDLIAGNDDSDLQPLTKGSNVASALEEMVDLLDNLNGILDSMLMSQMSLNSAVSNHFHFSPFFGSPTTPSPPVQTAAMKCMLDHLTNVKKSLVFHKVNLVNYKNTYLQPMGSKYINSRLNNTN
jgi:hypothetical protein